MKSYDIIMKEGIKDKNFVNNILSLFCVGTLIIDINSLDYYN